MFAKRKLKYLSCYMRECKLHGQCVPWHRVRVPVTRTHHTHGHRLTIDYGDVLPVSAVITDTVSPCQRWRLKKLLKTIGKHFRHFCSVWANFLVIFKYVRSFKWQMNEMCDVGWAQTSTDTVQSAQKLSKLAGVIITTSSLWGVPLLLWTFKLSICTEISSSREG